jgi:hypothetical protein
MQSPSKFGISLSDLPAGALGMPVVVFEDTVEYDEIIKEINNAEGDEAGTE